MKIPFIGMLLFLCPLIGWAQTNTATASGAWESGSNWSLGHAPLATENAIVPSPYTMTVNATDSCLSLTINSGGTVTINGAENISIGGNFSNSGTFTSNDPGSSVTFDASGNSVVSGAGAYTIGGTIVLDMGAITTSLDVQSSNFSNALTGSFTLTQGTFIMDNSGTIADCYTNTISQLIIPNTVVIQANQGTMYLGKNATQGNVLLEGELYMNGGSVYVAAGQGYDAGIDFQYKVVGGISPILKIASGNLYVFAGFNANSGSDYINYNMSGGTLFIAYSISNTNGGWSYGHTFQLQDVLGGQTVMTGGTIILQDACDSYCFDLDMGGANVAATLYSVTGGTIQLGYTNTQGAGTWFGIEPEATTNYPNLDFESGISKVTSPWTAADINFISMHINPSMTFDCTQFNNNVSFTGSNGLYALDVQGTLNTGTGTFSFNGSVPQIISGTAPITLTNVVINNSSTGAFLRTPMNIVNNLALTNGLLNTTSTNLVTIMAGGGTSGGSTTSYVNGYMAKTGNTAFTFPIGGSGRFMPLGISAPATATNTITTNYTYALPVNPTSYSAPLTNVSTLEYWTMSETVLTDAVSVTLNWQHGPASGILNYNNTLMVSDYSGGIWNNLGQGAIAGTFPGAGSVTANNTITNFNSLPVTFGSTAFNINPLPITLTSFTATYTNESNSVLTSWTVATQLNNKEFIVEKTLDGINYTQVATVAGAGTTPFTLSYSAVDPNPTPGVSYYRLKQIDMDGTPTAFSPVEIFIQDQQTNSTLLNLYPDPVTTTANLDYTATDGGTLAIDIIDISGRTIRSFEFSNVQSGENNFTLNASGLSRGVYFLRVTESQKVSKLKFIKL